MIKTKFIFEILITAYLLLLVVPTIVFGQEIVTMTTLPGMPNPGESGVDGYITTLYTVSISAAALLVVIKLIIAGVKYMFSEIVTDNSDAKKDIQAALLGILIILAAVTVLNTINPQLTNLDILGNAEDANGSVQNSPNSNQNNSVLNDNDGAILGSTGCDMSVDETCL